MEVVRLTRTGTSCTQGSGSIEGAGSTSASKTLLHTPLIVSLFGCRTMPLASNNARDTPHRLSQKMLQFMLQVCHALCST